MDTRNFAIIIYGPTGVGKTECANRIADVLPVELINCDMGQLYTPLTIGTAKPDWKAASVAHHLFDLLDTPILFSVMAYRKKLSLALAEISNRNKIPLIIGGSSFYLFSLFFPPAQHEKEIASFDYSHVADPWNMLHEIDPDRAKQIAPSDTYRIIRALDIWQSTGTKPSIYQPKYDPIADYYLVWLTRDRDELYDRIDERVNTMMQRGWLDEVRQLRGTQWESFLREKRIIGYDEILDHFEKILTYDEMITAIQQRTRHYAKRQITFWKMLKKKLEAALKSADPVHATRCKIDTLNLTDSTVRQYIDQLKQAIHRNVLE